MGKIRLKRFFVISLSVIFILSLISFTTSCAPELSFGDLVICEDINQETCEPLNPKDEFDVETKKICASIEFSGVKGEDNYRFKWVNIDTGENILDITLKYSESESGYLEGYAASSIETTDEVKVIPPGNYKVEFYNNGELVKTTTFKVNKPQMKILEVLLANQVDENHAPVNTTQKFSSEETVYACIKVDYQIVGNSLKAQWKSETEELLNEIEIDLTIDHYEPSYITCMFQWETGIIPAGNYKVEIYLNDNLYGTYDFEVIEEGGAEAGEDIFTQGNTYSNDKYDVSFAVPDNWTYTESDGDDSLEVQLVAPSEDLPVAFLFMVSPTGDYPPKDQWPGFVDEMNSEIAIDHDWELIDIQKNELVSKDGIPYCEFIYRFNDPDNNEWATATAFLESNNRLYVLFATVRSDYYNMGQPIYYGIIESLKLK